MSFLQLGLREHEVLLDQHFMLPTLVDLPNRNLPPACASKRKRDELACRVEFAKVLRFSS